jgi:hypothetical protein
MNVLCNVLDRLNLLSPRALASARRAGHSLCRPIPRARRLKLHVEVLEDRVVPTATVRFHGDELHGNVLTNVEVETVYYGSAWANNPPLQQNAQKLDQFFQYLTRSSYMMLLHEYYEELPFVGRVYPGAGRWTGRDLVLANPPSPAVTDATIKSLLRSQIGAGSVPRPNTWQTLYFVYLPPGIASWECQVNHCGAYHSSFIVRTGTGQHGVPTAAQITYAVVPYPDYPANSENALMWQTIYGSHELAEAVTNPNNGFDGPTDLGLSWYADGNQFADGKGREIGDLCASPNLKIGLLNNYWVQAEWSNSSYASLNPVDHRILPAGTTQWWAEGRGDGVFPPGSGSTGTGFPEDEDPLRGHLPTVVAHAYRIARDTTLALPAGSGILAGASDPNGRVLQASLVTGAAHGDLTLSRDGAFTYTPRAGFAGTDTFTYEAGDSVFQSNPTQVTIAVYNPAPTHVTATAGMAQSATVTRPFGIALQARVTDQYGEPLRGVGVAFAVPGSGPSGSFGGSTAVTVPTNASGLATAPVLTANRIPGAYQVTAAVADVAMPANFPLSNTPNRPPMLGSLGDKILAPGSTLTFTAQATDPDGDGLRFSLDAGAPAGAAINPGTGVFTWTPTEEQTWPRYTATVRVTDNGSPPLSDVKTFTITIDEGKGVEPQAQLWVATVLTHSGEYYGNIVTGAYRRYLGRNPDAAGLANWVGSMQHGLTDEQLEAAFIGSPEYIQSHGGTGEAWVVGLYRDLLGRDPDAQGLQAWLNALRGGMSPGQIALGFAASGEREGQRITADYQKYLGRDPEPNIVLQWVAAFLHGASNENVVAGFVGSPEYFQNHHSDIRDWLFSAYQDILGRAADPAGYNARLEFLRKGQ